MNMRRTYLFFIVMLLFGGSAWAQETPTVKLIKDPRVDVLEKKHIEINEFNTRDARRFVQGYRLLVINTNDRNKANEAKAKVYKTFPELKAYLVYQSPFYKLKVGNFKDQKEADVYLKKVQLYFPATVYIIRDMIEVNPDKSGELEK